MEAGWSWPWEELAGNGSAPQDNTTTCYDSTKTTVLMGNRFGGVPVVLLLDFLMFLVSVCVYGCVLRENHFCWYVCVCCVSWSGLISEENPPSGLRVSGKCVCCVRVSRRKLVLSETSEYCHCEGYVVLYVTYCMIGSTKNKLPIQFAILYIIYHMLYTKHFKFTIQSMYLFRGIAKEGGALKGLNPFAQLNGAIIIK